MSRKVLILKESELVELIQNTVSNINEQSYSKDKWLSGDYNPSSSNYQVQSNFDNKQREAVTKGLQDFGGWFYRAFVECDETIDCIQNALDGIAIVGAFIPGGGWVVSAVAGLASAGISFYKGDHAMGTAMVVFELFPITRIGKRIAGGVKAANAVEVDKIMVKMLDNGFNAQTYRTLKGTDKEIADYLLKNVDEIADDVMLAVKKLKNNPAAKDLMRLSKEELMGVALKTGVDYANLKVAVEMMKSQAKNIDDYAAFFSTWRNVAKEIGFVSAMIITGLGTYIGVEWIKSVLYGGDEELYDNVQKQVDVLIEEGGLSESVGDAMSDCRVYAEILLLTEEGCNVEFTNWLKLEATYSEDKTPMGMLNYYLSVYEGKEKFEEIKYILEEYASYGSACLAKKWKPGKVGSERSTLYLEYVGKAYDSGVC
tara:strand:- start:4047 stop:5327 length:1281 start_codon:yes stop_codon:yes gene_type:complete